MVGRAFKLVKERITKIVKHDRYREAMAATETMEVDPILNRALNEFTIAMLTFTVGRICLGAITKHARTLEQQPEDELKAVEAKHAEQLAVVVEEKAKLAKELEEKQKSLEKVREQRDQFRESNCFNFRAAQYLEVDMAASRQETTALESRIEELEKANARNLESFHARSMGRRKTHQRQLIDMDSQDVFEHYKAVAASSGKKKDSKRSRGESSKTASKKGLLTMTASWRRAGAMVSRAKNFDTRLAEAKKALEEKNTELLEKNNELTKENGELLEKSTELSKQKEELLEQKATLTEELLEVRDGLKKSNEDKEKFRQSAKLNYQQSVQLELDLIASMQETDELEKHMLKRAWQQVVSEKQDLENFSMLDVLGSKADAVDKFLDADPAEKMATRLFTVTNLNRYKLFPVSEPELLWHISERKKKVVLAEPHSDGGEAECVPERTYTVAQRFADSAQDLSASNAERDRLTVQVQGLKRELAETKLKLEKALAKASSSSKKEKRATTKVVMLQEKVTCLEADLKGAKATITTL
ncbi:uncharacterized protein LOC133779269 [Humulus lupulus]|uniref:uncharacterized protein LOC133779269 n=1 Tax=Humulus lupulus TaxID=3486 RepID=UPI002B403931|nr:uncharacterized protein LOC133779269 [Humulus lupulus]